MKHSPGREPGRAVGSGAHQQRLFMAIRPEHLKASVAAGLLSFPVTHFTADGAFDPEQYRAHVAYLLEHSPAALFAASFGFAPKDYFDLGADRQAETAAPAVKF